MLCCGGSCLLPPHCTAGAHNIFVSQIPLGPRVLSHMGWREVFGGEPSDTKQYNHAFCVQLCTQVGDMCHSVVADLHAEVLELA